MRTGAVAALAVLTGLALAAPGQAAFPGANGRIVFSERGDGSVGNQRWGPIRTMGTDGTDVTFLTDLGTSPAWSADGTKVAFERGPSYTPHVAVVNQDGGAESAVTSTTDQFFELEPDWSPDGRIAYTRKPASFYDETCSSLWVIAPDGSGAHEVLAPEQGPCFKRQVAWSPNGSLIAFSGGSSGKITPTTPTEIYTVRSDGTDLKQITSNGGNSASQPDWSPSGAAIAYRLARDRPQDAGWEYEFRVMGPDGTNDRLFRVTTDFASVDMDERLMEPAWSPDGTLIAFQNEATIDGPGGIYVVGADNTGLRPVHVASFPSDSVEHIEPDWQPIPINAYPRPKGATPFLTYLVPAYNACASPNRQHGPPLAFASCNPPTQSSNALTVGSADSNGKATKSVSSVRFDTVVGNPSTTADEADVKITAQVIDVYTQAGLNDYAGEVTAKTTLRITDKLNTPHPGGPGAGTVSDVPYGFTIPCAATADTTIGGACLLSTSADALAPGAVTEGKRSIWALGQVAVYDANDVPFMKQGIFVP